ncbi:hypothetical protein IWW39_001039 [Coemansia spiralis]|uniref:NAD-dependent epimerase/dehydratase domain-containing protein n=1 Tax=Coemansia spiralis TaxID=417178 RepID=A0A9W8GIS9_9FUNG|nr:hypothetical protein IWW39_001039 [Coemansia spiralis]
MTNILVLGASGYTGKEVSRAFSRAGFRVRSLVRNEEEARLLAQDEIHPIVGDIKRLDLLTERLDEADVIVDTSIDYNESLETTRNILNAVKQAGERRAHRGGQLTFIHTSGVWVQGETGYLGVSQDWNLQPLEGVAWRVRIEQETLELARALNVRPVVLRPALVYGRNGGFFDRVFAGLVAGNIRLPGTLENNLSTIHVDDLAELYVKITERAPVLKGQILTAANRSSEPVQEIIRAVRRLAGKREIQVESYRPTNVGDEGVALTQVIDTRITRTVTDWEPRKRTFVEGVAEYYQSWKAVNGQQI